MERMFDVGKCFPGGIPWKPEVPPSENKGSARKFH
jgi:hypothetical protein